VARARVWGIIVDPLFLEDGHVRQLAAVCLTLGLGATPLSALEPFLGSRDPGAHRIEYTVVLDASPDEVFHLWSTEEGLERFLAPGATVEGTVGGLYQITFDPENDPEGAHHGTKGARLLHLVPGTELAAEWTFPPLGEKLNTPPFPTWIEVRVAPAPGHPGRTLLHFSHYGFADDPDWEKAWRFFNEGNWPQVLNRLVVYCRDGVSPAWGVEGGDTIDHFIRKEAVVSAPLADVWTAWTTEGGVRFIAGGAKIELTPGGPYEWYFSMGTPEGSRGGEGNTVLVVEPPHLIAFEWNAPPSFPEIRKQRHQVLVQLEPRGNDETRVVLTSLGFGAGPKWAKVHAYFEKAWDTVLGRLKASLEDS
jgi:uncharacterized protein YndB with AHSA1/START domain